MEWGAAARTLLPQGVSVWTAATIRARPSDLYTVHLLLPERHASATATAACTRSGGADAGGHGTALRTMHGEGCTGVVHRDAAAR